MMHFKMSLHIFILTNSMETMGFGAYNGLVVYFPHMLPDINH